MKETWLASLSPFWQRALTCNHENLSPDYAIMFACWGAVGCRAYEYHCLDCGAYISRCDCGTEDGISGWSRKRWRTHELKQKTGVKDAG